MNSREKGRVNSSCYWIDGSADIEQEETYPDKFAVNSTATYDASNLEYILASPKKEKETDNYKLRCCLFKSTVDRIESVVNSEIEHTTNKCVSLVKAFIQNVLMWVIPLLFTHSHYEGSKLLPICLSLIDISTYNHTKKDLFGIGSFCSQTLRLPFLEVDELTGYDIIREEVERQMEKGEGRKLVVYLYQSEAQRQESIKEIVEYCLYCRVPNCSRPDA